ncbi:hypothetical protein, partial [Burkholderia pseudomallei]
AQLISQSVANGVNTVLGSKGGEPPIAGPGTVLVNSSMEQAANASLTGSRGAPSNAILSNNGGDDANANANGATGNGPYSNLTDSSSVGPGKNFTATQKKNIIEQNMANNGGELRSDLDGTLLVPASKSQKGVTPPPNEVQIDHIVAKNPADSSAPAGTNSYSNAQVLSREQNRDKSNKPPK